jgi:hypothetical protein
VDRGTVRTRPEAVEGDDAGLWIAAKLITKFLDSETAGYDRAAAEKKLAASATEGQVKVNCPGEPGFALTIGDLEFGSNNEFVKFFRERGLPLPQDTKWIARHSRHRRYYTIPDTTHSRSRDSEYTVPSTAYSRSHEQSDRNVARSLLTKTLSKQRFVRAERGSEIQHEIDEEHYESVSLGRVGLHGSL